MNVKVSVDPLVLAAAAEAMHASARAHKRAEAAHRRARQDLMRELDLFLAECERSGVRIQITETTRRSE